MSSLNYQIVPVTSFAQNCSVLWCENTKDAVIVDPGGDAEKIQAVINKEGLKVQKVLLTHGHLDHAGIAAKLSRELDVPIWGPHKEDKFWLDGLAQQAQMFGFEAAEPFEPGKWLEGSEQLSFGECHLDVYHCPGHTPGHLVFFCKEEKLAIVGDVLFRGSIGRTDFPRGDSLTLIRSIKEILWPLGNDVRFIPGHGPMSTFGEERASNPFVGDGVE